MAEEPFHGAASPQTLICASSRGGNDPALCQSLVDNRVLMDQECVTNLKSV